jgi:septum formation protein
MIASASVARENLPAASGLQFHVQPAQANEEAIKRIFKSSRQTAAACALAEAKARQVAENHRSGLVFSADQILVCDGSWFNRPDHGTRIGRSLLTRGKMDSALCGHPR